MRPDTQDLPAVVATWRSMVTLAVAVVLMISWAWRDGFDPGDLIGGLVTGVATFAVIAAVHWFRVT